MLVVRELLGLWSEVCLDVQLGIFSSAVASAGGEGSSMKHHDYNFVAAVAIVKRRRDGAARCGLLCCHCWLPQRIMWCISSD